MPHTTDDGLSFEPPAGFHLESATATLRVAAERGLGEAGLAGPVRPNLVVERRRVAPGAKLAESAAAIQEDLARSVPGLKGFDAVDVSFEDGALGLILGYSFPAPRVEGVVICQLRALRLDGEMLSSLTLTTTLANLTETRRDQFLRILASARLASAATPKEGNS